MSTSSLLELRAPVNGILVPLDAVPDAVFAGRMTGDGIAIEPLGAEFVAPCDARVMHVHRAGHAITLEAQGVELLLHVGLDTVQLGGEGFTPLVDAGDLVSVGTPLLRINADLVSRRARSLVTPLLVTNMDVVERMESCTGEVLAGRDVVLRVVVASTLANNGIPAIPMPGSSHARASFRIVAESGLHARPAATLAAAARLHSAVLRLEKGGRIANVRSIVAVLSLEVDRGDVVTLAAEGHDAEVALGAITEALLGGLAVAVAEADHVADSIGLADLSSVSDVAEVADVADVATENNVAVIANTRASIQREPLLTPEAGSELRGVSAAPGTAFGRVVVRRYTDDVDKEAAESGTVEQERSHLERAITRAHHELGLLRQDVSRHDEQHAEIFAAHQELLADPELMDAADRRIARGLSARRAWRAAFTDAVQALEGLRNPLLAARAADLRDVGRRVLSVLQGADGGQQRWQASTVLIADELTPSELVSLDRSRVVGVVTISGSANSHVAILARGLSLPLLTGVPSHALAISEGTQVWLDADQGVLHVDPAASVLGRLRTRAEGTASRRARELAAAHAPATTRDGTVIEVAANIGDVADAARCASLGADGVGLLRSEFAFLHRRTAPDEEAQVALYTGAAAALPAGQTLVIRTLDVGGDKPLPFLPMDQEANPFLGVRGIRLTLANPELMRTQIRAILRASVSGKVALMFPMISSLAEWRSARAMVEEERAALRMPPIAIGIMVETAAAALLAETFSREADFLSLGTNDLTQYTLAIDRTHPVLSAQVDALHPAVLQLVAHTVRGAHANGRPVSVCGTLAADPHAIPVLLGLGVHKLSVDGPLVPSVKWRVRSLQLDACRETARLALLMGEGDAIRALVDERHAMSDVEPAVQDPS